MEKQPREMPVFTRLFRGAFGVVGMFSHPLPFSQKCFPHPSAGALSIWGPHKIIRFCGERRNNGMSEFSPKAETKDMEFVTTSPEVPAERRNYA